MSGVTRPSPTSSLTQPCWISSNSMQPPYFKPGCEVEELPYSALVILEKVQHNVWCLSYYFVGNIQQRVAG